MTLLLAYRFLNHPSARRFALVAMAGICAVGLSGSGVFLIPCLIFSISLAYLSSYGFSRAHLSRALILNFASFYCIALAVGLVVGIIPEPADSSVWGEGWPLTWWENLGLVIGDNATLIRNLLILFILPLIVLPKPMNRFPAFLTICLCLIFTNPLMGPFWMDKIKPGSYWRLAYLFPLAWCAGLAICGLNRSRLSYKAYLLQVVFIMIVLLGVANAYQSSVFTPAQTQAPIYFKLPWEYKFPPHELAFARSISTRLQNKNLLAPESIVYVLGLIDPTIKFEATRSAETLHLFRNIGQEEEGLRRVAAQGLVTTCIRSPQAEAALLGSLEMGVNAVIVHDCGLVSSSNLITFAAIAPGQWQEVERNNGYILFLRNQ